MAVSYPAALAVLEVVDVASVASESFDLFDEVGLFGEHDYGHALFVGGDFVGGRARVGEGRANLPELPAGEGPVPGARVECDASQRSAIRSDSSPSRDPASEGDSKYSNPWPMPVSFPSKALETTPAVV